MMGHIKRSDLDELYKKKVDIMYKDRLKSSANYNTFLQEIHKPDNDNIIQNLYSIHLRHISNTIGSYLSLFCLAISDR
jgi:hypothetical protein